MQMNKQGIWTDHEWIRHHLEAHGFVNVQVNTADQLVHIESAESFADRFDIIFDWVMNDFWTPEQKEKYAATVKERMVEHLREKHGGKGWDTQWTMIIASGEKTSVDFQINGCIGSCSPSWL